MGNTNVLLDSKAQEIMKDVYHLGGGSSDLGLIYPNTKLQQLDDALAIGDFDTHSDEYTYIKLSDLMGLLEEKVDLSTILLDTENNTNALHIRLLTSFADFKNGGNITTSIAEIYFNYREDSTAHYLIIKVTEPTSAGMDILYEETEISFEPSGHTFKDLLEYYIATIGDTKIILSRYDSSLQIKFTRGLEPAIYQPFFTCLAFNKEIYDGETKEVFLAHLDMDSFISKIHKEE